MGALGNEPTTGPPRYVLGYTAVSTRSWSVTVPIGASGATGTLAGPRPSSFAITKNTTGVYDMTGIPTCAGDFRMFFSFYSPALTITHYALTAASVTSSGTATLKTLKNDVAAEPASGDKIWIYFEGEDG